MPDPSSEADARIVIDDLLRRAGWDPANKADVLTEFSIADPGTGAFAVGDAAQAPYGDATAATVLPMGGIL